MKTEDYKNCLVLKTEDLATKPTKPEDRRFAFLAGKIWLWVWLTEKTAPGDTSPYCAGASQPSLYVSARIFLQEFNSNVKKMSVWLICDLSCCIEESWLLASLLFGVRNGLMVKGRGSGQGDPGLIPFTGTHFWICCGVPFILPRTLQNGTKNIGGPLYLHAQHTVEGSTSSRIVADFGRDGYRAWFEYYGLCCTLESITLSELKTWHRILSPRHLCIFYCVLKIWYIPRNLWSFVVCDWQSIIDAPSDWKGCKNQSDACLMSYMKP